MALFFDADWFDSRLHERGLSRKIMAACAGMSDDELALVFKDQRELSTQEVAIFADLLGVTAAEIASHAGISTPTPGGDDEVAAQVSALEGRVDELEAEVAALKTLVFEALQRPRND